jgi:hypothetical protein
MLVSIYKLYNMYIERQDQNKKQADNHPPETKINQKIDEFLRPKEEKEELLESPHDYFIPQHSEDVLAHWKAPEYEVFERDKKWYIVITTILTAIIAWALYTNSPVMAITFILIGVVGYLHLEREPRILDFMITNDGVLAGREIYEFDNLESFWIFYEPEGLKAISFHAKHGFLPYINIPVHEEDPAHLRQILLEFLPEEKKEPGLMEVMERVLKL